MVVGLRRRHTAGRTLRVRHITETGQRRLKPKALATVRMHERKPPRMKQERPPIMAIPRIAHDRMPGLCEMDAYLVLAPALQLHLHKGRAALLSLIHI